MKHKIPLLLLSTSLLAACGSYNISIEKKKSKSSPQHSKLLHKLLHKIAQQLSQKPLHKPFKTIPVIIYKLLEILIFEARPTLLVRLLKVLEVVMFLNIYMKRCKRAIIVLG